MRTGTIVYFPYGECPRCAASTKAEALGATELTCYACGHDFAVKVPEISPERAYRAVIDEIVADVSRSGCGCLRASDRDCILCLLVDIVKAADASVAAPEEEDEEAFDDEIPTFTETNMDADDLRDAIAALREQFDRTEHTGRDTGPITKRIGELQERLRDLTEGEK